MIPTKNPIDADWKVYTAITTLFVALGGTRALSDPTGGKPARIVPVQAIRVADDDGQRRTLVTPDEVADWFAYANEVFAIAGIAFSFDPNADDSADLNSTLLNNVSGVDDLDWRTARDFGKSGARGYPDKLVVFLRRGPGPGIGAGGFSWWDYNFVVMPRFAGSLCGHQNISL